MPHAGKGLEIAKLGMGAKSISCHCEDSIPENGHSWSPIKTIRGVEGPWGVFIL